MMRFNLLFALLFALSCSIFGQTIDETPEKEAVKQLVQSMATAMANNDVAALDAILTENYESNVGNGRFGLKLQTLAGLQLAKNAKRSFPPIETIIDDILVNSTRDKALVSVRTIIKTTGGNTPPPLALTHICLKENGKWKIAATHQSLTSATLPANLSLFDILPVPQPIKDLSWKKIAEDTENDGLLKQSNDGKTLYFYFDKSTDMLWFKFELFNSPRLEDPAVSLSFDLDSNQQNGLPWWGTNKQFKYDKLLSVGAMKKQGSRFVGYNGVTNQEGASKQNWINEKQGIITFYVDSKENAYFLGIKRADIAPDLQKFNVIGSVGAQATWNDDIGETGFATIDFKE